MPVQVVILNGGSSSGKSTVARRLQDSLAQPWLAISVDTLVDAMPESLKSGGDGIGFTAEGGVDVGEAFRTLDIAWSKGIAAMVHAGANMIIDDVFLGGPESQQRWRTALEGLHVLWVGVHCDPRVAAEREAARGDRTIGMAALQAQTVHRDVEYDLVVDTSTASAEQVALTVKAAVESRS